MKKTINKLAWYCKSRSSENLDKDLIEEIVDLILSMDSEDEKRLELLVEIYRFTYYSRERITSDPGSDHKLKSSQLIYIKFYLQQNIIDKKQIESLKNLNDIMRNNIDNPIAGIKA